LGGIEELVDGCGVVVAVLVPGVVVVLPVSVPVLFLSQPARAVNSGAILFMASPMHVKS
jgi:hypothetical protein